MPSKGKKKGYTCIGTTKLKKKKTFRESRNRLQSSSKISQKIYVQKIILFISNSDFITLVVNRDN